MPLYEYQCLTNGHTFEVRHPITQDPVTECPVCGSEVRRVIHPVGIVFKGSGFYATDSRGKGVSSSTRSADSADAKSGSEATKSSSDTKSADSATSTTKEAAKPSTAASSDTKSGSA